MRDGSQARSLHMWLSVTPHLAGYLELPTVVPPPPSDKQSFETPSQLPQPRNILIMLHFDFIFTTCFCWV